MNNKIAGMVAAGFFAGVVLTTIVNIVDNSKTEVPEPTPQPTVTVTTEVSSTYVPQECLDALESADRDIDILLNSISLAADSFEAISNGDFETLEKLNEMVGENTEKIQESTYVENRDACLAYVS